ncbi:MAG: hypothetical protein MJ095_00185 [Oscillospiraceae bacterium]|nr:hypothetical protein [Oscillospiraceae bacterium]
MAKLQTNYEFISNKSNNPVTTTPYIKHGTEWLDVVIDGKASTKYVDDAIKGITDGEFVHDDTPVMRKTVPEGCSKGIVSMIGGKTVKTKNLLNIDALPNLHTVYGLLSDVDIQPRPDGSLSLSGTSNGSGSWSFYRAFPENATLLKPEHTYTIVCYSSKPVQFGGRLYMGASTQIQTFLTQTQTTGLRTVTFTTMARTGSSGEEIWDRIGIWFRVVSAETYNDDTVWCMILDGESTDTDYEQYFDGLHSAPVESVSVEGINMFNEKTELGSYSSTDGEPVASTTTIRMIGYIPIEPNTNYYMNKAGRFCFYDSNKSFVSTVFESSSSVFATSPATARYMRVNLSSGYGTKYKHNIIVAKSDVSVNYKPYRKTILSLADIIPGLPDYGKGIDDTYYNYIDFEEMKYHRNVTSLRLSDYDWTYESTYKQWTTGEIAFLSNVYMDSNIICSNLIQNSGNYDTAPYTHIRGVSYKKIKLSTIESDVTNFKNLIKDSVCHCALATPEIIDISDILTPFMCEFGGVITMENKYNLDMPNTVVYEKEVK